MENGADVSVVTITSEIESLGSGQPRGYRAVVEGGGAINVILPADETDGPGSAGRLYPGLKLAITRQKDTAGNTFGIALGIATSRSTIVGHVYTTLPGGGVGWDFVRFP